MVQNDKQFCPLHSISQEPYIIWLSFMVQICKMISSGIFSLFFYFFKILIFWLHRGKKGQKTVQNDKKVCLSRPVFQEPYIIQGCIQSEFHTCWLVWVPKKMSPKTKIKQFLTLLLHKLQNKVLWCQTVKQTDTVSFIRTLYDLNRSRITDLHKFLKKHSVGLSWCNLTICI